MNDSLRVEKSPDCVAKIEPTLSETSVALSLIPFELHNPN